MVNLEENRRTWQLKSELSVNHFFGLEHNLHITKLVLVKLPDTTVVICTRKFDHDKKRADEAIRSFIHFWVYLRIFHCPLGQDDPRAYVH